MVARLGRCHPPVAARDEIQEVEAATVVPSRPQRSLYFTLT